MFNWSTAPTFAAALLFWLLAAYVLTRGRRDAISAAAVVALASTAVHLLGEAMEANAPSTDEWRLWARGLRWGAPLSAVGWYWLTVLSLRDAGAPVVRRYLRWAGYPLGFALLVGGVLLTLATYVDDWLWQWSVEPHDEADQASYLRYYAPAGPLYPAFVLHVAAAAIGAAVNLTLAWWAPPGEGRRRRFSLLLLSLALFVPEVGSTIAYHL
jgi:N-terminal 7TM region of histidine kinase